ncbi:MAG: hypothetical protein V8R64_12675 [Thomasclavelia sp.]
MPKIRGDKGTSRKLTKCIKEKIIKLKTDNPRMTATSVYLKLIEDGDILKRMFHFQQYRDSLLQGQN